jgi:hypothetical protein
LRTRHRLRADDAAEAFGIVDLHCQSPHSHRRRVEVLRSLTAAVPCCSPPPPSPPPPPFMPLRVLPSKKNWLFYPPTKEGGGWEIPSIPSFMVNGENLIGPWE